jgi:hypothetical protein
MMAKEALEKGKADSDLNGRLSKIELLLKDIGNKTPLVDPLVSPQVKPLEPREEGFVKPSQTSGTKRPSEPYIYSISFYISFGTHSPFLWNSLFLLGNFYGLSCSQL